MEDLKQYLESPDFNNKVLGVQLACSVYNMQLGKAVKLLGIQLVKEINESLFAIDTFPNWRRVIVNTPTIKTRLVIDETLETTIRIVVTCPILNLTKEIRNSDDAVNFIETIEIKVMNMLE